MKELNLKVEKRDEVGKGPNRRLRADGNIPAVVYGPDIEPISIQINYRDLYRLMHGKSLSTIINLDIEGHDSAIKQVLIRELQKDPVSGDLLHIDFRNIDMTKPITITVPVRTEGIPDGVKNFGGIVSMIRREIEVSCLPSAIPEEIVINIEALGVGDSIHVSEVDAQGLDILTDPERTIVTVVAPTVIKEPTVEEEEEGEEGVEGEAVEGAEGEAKEGEAKEGEDDKKKDDKK